MPSVLLNNGDGSIGPSLNFDGSPWQTSFTPPLVTGLDVADFDGDGKADVLIVADSGGDSGTGISPPASTSRRIFLQSRIRQRLRVRP